jgi:hypothetical protein
VRRRCAVLVGTAAICAVTAGPVSAQVIRTRPFPGIFGSGDPAKSVTQVDFISFIGGGYESVTASLGRTELGSSEGDNSFGNLVFRGRLAHQGRRTVFGAQAGATTSYFSGIPQFSPFSLSTGANFSGEFGRRGTFSLRQTIFYSPYYVLGALTPETVDGTDPTPDTPDDGVDPRVDQRASRLSTKGYASFASVGRQVGRDGLLFGAYTFNFTDYAPGVYDLMVHAPRGGYRHRLSRFSYLNASYGIQMYEYRTSPYSRLTSQNIALGVGYDRPLSAWRRTTVGFNVSTAVVDDSAFTRFYVNANARLYRRFGRTWVAGVTYLRGQQVLEGFTAPFFTFSDAVTGSFSGRLVRDITLSGRGTFSHNRYTLDEATNEYDTLAASVRVQIPVMWALAAYVEGYYADHDFEGRVGLLERVPTSLERLGMRAGLTVSVPVLR